MPGDDGLWLDNYEDIAPARPAAEQRSPEEPVPGVQFRPRPFAFEHRNLLPEREDFDGGIAPGPEEDTDHGEYGEDEFEHEFPLVTWRNVVLTRRRPEIVNA